MASKRKRIEDRIWKLVQQVVRERDNYTCQRCGKYRKPDPGSGVRNFDCSHVFGRGAQRDPYLKWDVENVKLMCFTCHQWFAECPTESGEWFAEKFPDRLAYLRQLVIDRRFRGSVPEYELEEIEQSLKDKLKGMK